MTIELNNIGIIKEATVKIDGLTVIAGENDTGKSTVGKAIFMMLKSFSTRPHPLNMLNYSELLFKDQLIENTRLNLYYDSGKSSATSNKFGEMETHSAGSIPSIDPIFIETPLVWNFTDFFRDIAQIESQIGIKVDYPYLMKDLNFKLFIKNASDGIDIQKEVTSLMNGEFKKDEMGRFFFDKKGLKIDLLNTATGIKYFGLFQVLSQNNYLNENAVLILDEPEVHLHPKWQLEMAKLIVELVKNGVKIVVNSHSPYMIEALKRYSEIEKIEDKTNFYLAEDRYIKQIDDSNSQTLVAIYEKLSEPYDTFEQMESDRFSNG
jgi:predicted ATPase